MIALGERRAWTLRLATTAVVIGRFINPTSSDAQQPLPGLRLVAGAPAKTSALAGVVRDSLGGPIAYATVYVDGGVATTANDSGRFRLADVPSGRMMFGVRRMGYGQVTFALEMPEDTTVLVSIKMHQVIARLREVTVEEKRESMALFRSGFYDRQRASVGYFLLPTDISDRAPRRVEELMYGVPGVTVMNVNGRPVAYGSGQGGLCRLSVFLDGRRYQLRGQEELLIEVGDVKAAEIYARATEVPAQFHDPDNALCGVMVLWTKVD